MISHEAVTRLTTRGCIHTPATGGRTSREVPRRTRSMGRIRLRRATGMYALVFLAASTTALAGAAQSGFDQQMKLAMEGMDLGMTIPATGNPDHDFAAMMIPHHEGAITMARAEVAYGSDERLKRLASAIIVEQAQEVKVLQDVLSEGQSNFQKVSPNSASRRDGSE